MEEVKNTSPSEEGKVIEMKPTAEQPKEKEQPKPPTAAEIAEMRRQRSEYVKALKEDEEVLKLEASVMELRLKKLIHQKQYLDIMRENANTNNIKTVLPSEGTDSASPAAAE